VKRNIVECSGAVLFHASERLTWRSHELRFMLLCLPPCESAIDASSSASRRFRLLRVLAALPISDCKSRTQVCISTRRNVTRRFAKFRACTCTQDKRHMRISPFGATLSLSLSLSLSHTHTHNLSLSQGGRTHRQVIAIQYPSDICGAREHACLTSCCGGPS